MKKPLLLLFFILTLGLVLAFTKNPISNLFHQESEEIHLHAGFQVYRNNLLVDFSDFKYMHVRPCTADGEIDHNNEDEQLEKAHLHSKIGDVVHVHRAATLWRDLFENLGVTIDATATAYLNGQRAENFLDIPIGAYDSIVIFEGNNDQVEEKLSSAVTKEKIAEVESLSESCGKT